MNLEYIKPRLFDVATLMVASLYRSFVHTVVDAIEIDYIRASENGPKDVETMDSASRRRAFSDVTCGSASDPNHRDSRSTIAMRQLSVQNMNNENHPGRKDGDSGHQKDPRCDLG